MDQHLELRPRVCPLGLVYPAIRELLPQAASYHAYAVHDDSQAGIQVPDGEE